MTRRRMPWILGLAALLLLSGAGLAQRFGFGFRRENNGPRPTFPPVEGEFHFVRMEYTDLPEYHRGFGYGRATAPAKDGGWWTGPIPTSISPWAWGGSPGSIRGTPAHEADRRPAVRPSLDLRHTDGLVGLERPEIARLREYLLRGGFLVIDDFWGPEQWEIFRRTMERVFPGKPITDIAVRMR